MHVSLDAEAIDGRGRESAVEAFIQDPQSVKPALVKTTGLKAARQAEVPRAAGEDAGGGPLPRRAARRKAGRLQLSAPAYVTDESTGVPMFVLVTRTGGKKGKASVTVTHARRIGRGGPRLQEDEHDRHLRAAETPRRGSSRSRSSRTRSPRARRRSRISLSRARCAKLGAQRSAEVTIADDDTPPAAAAAASRSAARSTGSRARAWCSTTSARS